MGKILGEKTRAIGEKLKINIDADPLRYKSIELFYDHGDSSKPEICEPTPYIGTRYGNDATLAG